MTPCKSSGLMVLSMSGSAIAMPNEMVGMRPWPRPNSFIFSSTSFASEITVGRKKKRSGRVVRSCWIKGVASTRGGVKVSSTTSSSPSSLSRCSRIGLTDEIEAAVLSVTIATVFGSAPAVLASSTSVGSDWTACEPEVADVWKM
jgi:hypothetical protein